MQASQFIRETFDLDNKHSINELPNLPVSLVVRLLNNYAENKVEKLIMPDTKQYKTNKKLLTISSKNYGDDGIGLSNKEIEKLI